MPLPIDNERTGDEAADAGAAAGRTAAPRAPTPDRTTGTSARGSLLARWLLTAPQLHEGPHAGAIAGMLDGKKTASYVYPEIAGYHLRWLAFRALRSGSSEELAAGASATQRWLARWSALAGPPTRVHLDGTREDWRNDALFCFDLAMVLRGLGSAAMAGLITPDGALLRSLDVGLARCIGSDGAFDAIVPFAEPSHLPVRWSTRRGAFLAKAAAGVLRAATQLPVSPQVVAAAERTFEASIAMLSTAPHPEVHPLLYACEGILDLPRHACFVRGLPIVAARHATLLRFVTDEGYLPESTAAPDEGPARIDVIAQALRVAQLLGLHGTAPADTAALARLHHALASQVADDGGVPFARQSRPGERNTWAAMFTDQALAYPTLAPPASIADRHHASSWWREDPLLV